jgi:hypothetical protein
MYAPAVTEALCAASLAADRELLAADEAPFKVPPTLSTASPIAECASPAALLAADEATLKEPPTLSTAPPNAECASTATRPTLPINPPKKDIEGDGRGKKEKASKKEGHRPRLHL